MNEPVESERQAGSVSNFLDARRTPLVLSLGTFITVVYFSISSSFKIATHLNDMRGSVDRKADALLQELRLVSQQQAVLAEQQRRFNEALVELSKEFVQHEKMIGHEGMIQLQERTFKQVERLIDGYEKIGVHSHYDHNVLKYRQKFAPEKE